MSKFKVILGTVRYALKKGAPGILLGTGIAGVLGSTYLACRATLKFKGIMDEHEEESIRIDDCVILCKDEVQVRYSEQDAQQDRRTLMVATAGKLLRAYGPAASLMVMSIGCILGSHHIMAKRNVALMAAYKVIEEAFTKYRQRVVEQLGPTADAQFLYGQTPSDTTEVRKYTDADGVEHQLDPVLNHLSGFARSFEADKPDQVGSWTGSTQWSKVHEYNLDFLKSKMDHFNNMLVVKGFVTINDVYSELGFPCTEAGMICGWRYKSDRGDGYISFKPRETDGNWTFGINGDPIILDFNIDGVIFDQGTARREMK